MGGGEPGQLRADALSEQEFTTGLLVLRAGAGQFGDVPRLAHVVGGRAEERGLPVERPSPRQGTEPLADPEHRRIIIEPDARNQKAIERMVRAGFELGPEIDKPEKRARLAFFSREPQERRC